MSREGNSDVGRPLLLDLPTQQHGRWLFRSSVGRLFSADAQLTSPQSPPSQSPSQHSPCPPDSGQWAARWLPLTGPHAISLTSCAKAMMPNSFGGLCMCLCVWCMLGDQHSPLDSTSWGWRASLPRKTLQRVSAPGTMEMVFQRQHEDRRHW